MANPLLNAAPDRSVADALQAALLATRHQGRLSYEQAVLIMQAAFDGEEITDVEFRDVRKILRMESFWGPSRRLLEGFLQLYYPLEGPFVYPGDDVENLDGSKLRGNRECAALIQHTIPIGLANDWREGIRVRGNEHLIKKGTAIATFEDGIYPNRPNHNHVAYYVSQDETGIVVIDQWSELKSVQTRTMGFLGQRPDGSFIDPSNNGDALSVIMRKKAKKAT